MKDLISIVIPVYNVEDYLERCLNSVILQTYKNIEILLINDGSTDNSLEICKKYANTDNRIKIINQKNKGASSARNKGIECATGKYITFVDSDDWVETNFIEKLYEEIEDNDVIRCQYFVNREQEEIPIQENIKKVEKYSKEQLKKEIIYQFLTGKKMCYIYLLLIKKDILKKINNFNENLYIMEDTCFYLDLLCNINKIKFIPDNLYHHYYNSESLVTSPKNIKRNMFNILEINEYMRNIAIKNNVDKYLRDIDCMHFIIIINHILKFYKAKFKIKELRKILKEISKEKLFKELISRIDEKMLKKQYKIAFSLIRKERYTTLLVLWKIIYKLKG